MPITNKEYKQKWDERYQQEEYVYGTTANVFFKEQLASLSAGSILLPAEGEGRNAVHAAMKGWAVTAFDLSETAKDKANDLAKQQGVSIAYQVGSLEELNFEEHSFDAIGLVYAHFVANKREEYYQQLSRYLKPGGTLIFEGFAKSNLPLTKENPRIGGPREIELLFSVEEIKAAFATFNIELLEEVQVELNEGLLHCGTGSVIRFVGKKSV